MAGHRRPPECVKKKYQSVHNPLASTPMCTRERKENIHLPAPQMPVEDNNSSDSNEIKRNIAIYKSVDCYLAVVAPSSSWYKASCTRPSVLQFVNPVVVLPVVVFADVLKDDGNCSIVWPDPAEVWKTSFIVCTSTVGFFCPLLVICLCYLLIVIKVRSVGKRAQATSSRRRKSERKITRMVVVVVAVFVLCWLPFYALNIVNLLEVLPGDFRGLYFFVLVLSYANSCANPILYGFLSDNFKRGFRKALCRTSRRVKNNDRAGTEVPRPTEEWGGIVLQKCEGATNVHRKDCGENEEEEEINGTEGAMQMSEMCKIENGNHSGVIEGSRTQVIQRGKPEPGHSGELTRKGSDFDRADVMSTMASKSRNNRSQPEEFPDKNSVLEISYL
ncbi:somatostatin receptor type 5-like protein [Lates japonicus]|uniref:Somatostatin receptor type 5-like protein n=1 Tax=Lates japonicus TaxID=270547 RepID=A0AAD3NMG3_LATJO|nr:somatostatin receptor type 5-like protein [Lates japonicus]